MSTSPTMTASEHARLRAEILEDCIENDRLWAEQPGRNIVILFDGTGNILGNQRDTNVVKLMRRLRKGRSSTHAEVEQIVYYDPGVGTNNTFPPESLAGRIGQTLRRMTGLALGGGVFENIAEAYTFLIHTYRDGDRIFLFGFSRGAFTARALGGILNLYGLVGQSGIALIPSIVQNYFSTDAHRHGQGKFEFAREISTSFALGRHPLVHFTGVWDTVETIGSGFLGGLTITNSPDLETKRFRHIRHALALHENRCKYEPRTYTRPRFDDDERRCRSFDQRWFRGAHSDVGGSYERAGLSNIPLNWMMREAEGCGLLLADNTPFPEDRSSAMHDEPHHNPYWMWTGLGARARKSDDPVDPSALPIEQAVPATTVARTRPFFHVLGVLLLLGVLAAGILTGQRFAGLARHAPELGAGSFPAALFPLFGPWLSPPAVQRVTELRDHYLIPEMCFTIFFFLWLAFPMSFALRRLVAKAIPGGRPIRRLLLWTKYVMAAWLCSAVLKIVGESLFDLAFWRWICALATAVNIACLLVLAAIFVVGLAAGKDARAAQRPLGQGKVGLPG